ncbi:MAG: hypothetical protein HZB67_03445 [Candidatus Aenigmarchaeota archaeon]|nr:hypothetical protein [Candidatus Aenigmarchaeota archaeon]
MVYLGRVLGVGITDSYDDCEPTLVYAVSGRSQPSRERKATVPDAHRAYKSYDTVHIGPLDGSDDDPLRHYDAIMLTDGIGVVSSGQHTNEIMRQLTDTTKKSEMVLRNVLSEFGYEPDEYHTPRIAGIVENDGFYLGMVSENGVDIAMILPKPGDIFSITTYVGSDEENEKIIIPNALTIMRLPSDFDYVNGIANQLYEWMDKDFVVCVSAATYFGGSASFNNEWSVDVKNLHE